MIEWSKVDALVEQIKALGVKCVIAGANQSDEEIGGDLLDKAYSEMVDDYVKEILDERLPKRAWEDRVAEIDVIHLSEALHVIYSSEKRFQALEEGLAGKAVDAASLATVALQADVLEALHEKAEEEAEEEFEEEEEEEEDQGVEVEEVRYVKARFACALPQGVVAIVLREYANGDLSVCMVGDDQRIRVEADDVEDIGEEVWCNSCGQVGCSHGSNQGEEDEEKVEGEENEVFVRLTCYKDTLIIEGPGPAFSHPDWTPSGDGRIGCVVRNTHKHLGVSAEALEWLKKVPKSQDDIGDLDWRGTTFMWLGWSPTLKSREADASRYYEIIEGNYVVIPNDPPTEAKEAIDRRGPA